MAGGGWVDISLWCSKAEIIMHNLRLSTIQDHTDEACESDWPSGKESGW